MADKKLELKRQGPQGPDCTSLHSVIMDGTMSLREFIDAAMAKCPDCHGAFRIAGRDGLPTPKQASADYDKGRLLEAFPDDLMDLPVARAVARGGWSAMDWAVILGPAPEVPEPGTAPVYFKDWKYGEGRNAPVRLEYEDGTAVAMRRTDFDRAFGTVVRLSLDRLEDEYGDAVLGKENAR